MVSMSDVEMRGLNRPTLRFALAVVAVIAAFLLRQTLVLRFGIELPVFIIFYPAVMLVALLCGLWPGLLATALAAALADYWIIPPAGKFRIARTSDAIALVIFVGMGVLMSLVAERYRRNLGRMAAFEKEQALHGSEERFRALVMASSDVVYRMSADWSEMRTLLGRDFIADTDVPSGAWLEKYIHPDDHPRVLAAIGEAIRTKGIFELEHRVLRVDGSIGWTFSRAVPLKDAKGEIVEWLGSASDVTERKRAEQALREQAEILDLAHDTIMVRGLDGTIRFWNHGAEEMYGYSKEQAAGRILHELLRTVFPQPLAGIEAQVLRQGRWEGELIHTAQDGTRIVVASRWVLQRDKDGRARGLMEINNDITERKRADEALRESRELIQLFIDHAPAALAMFDREMRYLAASQRWLQEYSLAGRDFIGRSHYEIFPEIPERWKQEHRRGLAGEVIVVDEDRFERANGAVQWIRREIFPWRTADGAVGGLIIFTEDITKQRQAEQRLQLAASVFTHASEGILITARDGAILDVNSAFARITGYTRDEALGRNPRFLNSGRQDREFYAEMWRILIEKGEWSGEIWNRRKNGEIYATMQTISALCDANGDVQQYVALFHDVTRLKEHELQLEQIAYYDILTGLPNRALLADRLQQAMVQSRRREQLLGVALLDLDGFKSVNDRHGHDVGDQLLTALATRMRHALRQGDTLARLGGDEFVAVMLDLGDEQASVPVLTRLLDAAAAQTQVGEWTLRVSASVGVTFYPQPEDADADRLLSQADQAMYQAKLAGRNRYQFFDFARDLSARGRHENLKSIRQALEAHEFVLFYQPKVNMRTGEVVGAEALIRWQHPERGLLLPAWFLPTVENNPLAIQLGEWVIDAALAQMESWQAGGFDIPVSVNLGALQLQQDNFADRLRELLAAYSLIQPSRLELEVLETSALDDVPRTTQIFDACRKLGVSFALDDFGTGYSSLTHLKRLPTNVLKIDRSFVRDMLDDVESLAILEGVLGLAFAFQRTVIAEGVETVDQGLMLLQLGCDLAQGFCIAHPMPACGFPAWAATWRPDPRWANAPSMNMKDLALLRATVEHRSWIISLEAFVRGHRHDPPQLNHNRSRFRAWLDAELLAWPGDSPALQAIDDLHRQIHLLAAGILDLHAQSRSHEALESLTNLKSLRAALDQQVVVHMRRALPTGG
jgi:diguanylate cyclase (GGDEF)-like protein/PAS domain S-box-containing protein